MNIPSECKTASITCDHATILPHDANPKPDGIFGKDTSGASTPIVQLPNQPRMSIAWNLDDQRMLKRDELTALIAAEGSYSIALRLRESNALELQQRMPSDMGRVGLLSKMPFTFPVKVLMFTPDAQGNPKRLPITTRDGGACITGRDSNADVTRLILTEASVDVMDEMKW